MHSSLCGAIFFAVLFNLFNTAVISQCPNDQLRINCSCFAKHSDKALTWDSAKQRCSNIEATLASIQSLEENDMLGRYLKSGDNWIGLKAEVNSSLLLPNGEKAPPLFPDVNKKSFDTRTCIAIRPNSIWTATGCDAVHRFICQQPSRSSRKLRSVCPNGWKRFNNLCYWISKTTLNFNKAQQNCTARGAKLAEIYTKSEYEFLRMRLYDGVDSIDAWFGLQKVANVTKYTYSQSSEPNYTAIGVHFIPDISKHCVTIVLAKHDATWEAKQCDLKLNSYVCQTEINRDFDITVTNVNETSANISLSVNPPQCGLPRDSNFKLSDGNKVKRQGKVTNSWLMVNGLKPGREYTIEITGTNVMKSAKKFQTTEIKNPLQLLRRISSTKIHAMIGDTVNLLCAVRGEPPITLRWEKDKRKMESYVETEKPHRSSILSVKLSNQTSYGEYICHIQDRFSNMTHTFVVDRLPKDESEDNDQSFVIAIVILAITVAILLIIIAYFVNHLKLLKRKLNETKKVDTVTLKHISNEGGLYENQQELNAANKAANEYNVSVEDENASYTALRRNQNEEEDNFYAPLKEAPLYVNASEFKNTA